MKTPQKLIALLDGRTKRWLHRTTGIPYQRVWNILNIFTVEPTKVEMKQIADALNVKQKDIF